MCQACSIFSLFWFYIVLNLFSNWPTIVLTSIHTSTVALISTFILSSSVDTLTRSYQASWLGQKKYSNLLSYYNRKMRNTCLQHLFLMTKKISFKYPPLYKKTSYNNYQIFFDIKFIKISEYLFCADVITCIIYQNLTLITHMKR